MSAVLSEVERRAAERRAHEKHVEERYLLINAERRQSAQRFADRPSVFGPLLAADSLTARIERIWNMRPSVIEVSVGYIHPLDDSIIDWCKTAMTRAQAAKALREARANGLLIERGHTGYSISAVLNPAWSYA